jgi:hypothetical protein
MYEDEFQAGLQEYFAQKLEPVLDRWGKKYRLPNNFFDAYQLFQSYDGRADWRPINEQNILHLYLKATTYPTTKACKTLIKTIGDYALAQDPTNTEHIQQCIDVLCKTHITCRKHIALQHLVDTTLVKIAKQYQGIVAVAIINIFYNRMTTTRLTDEQLGQTITALNLLDAHIPITLSCTELEAYLALHIPLLILDWGREIELPVFWSGECDEYSDEYSPEAEGICITAAVSSVSITTETSPSGQSGISCFPTFGNTPQGGSAYVIPQTEMIV